MNLRLDGLRLQLLGLIILPFSVILLVLAFASVRIHGQAMRRLVAERDERAARSTAAAISEQLANRENIIRRLAMQLQDGVSPQDLIAQSRYLDSVFEGGIAVAGPTGEIAASSIPASGWRFRPVDELLASSSEGGAAFSQAVREGDSQIVLVAAGGGEYSILGAFTLSSILPAILNGSGEDAGYTLGLVDASGRLLRSAGPAPLQESLADHPGVQAALRGESGSSYLPAPEGEHVVAFSPVPATGWALIIEEPWESVVSPLLDLSLAAPLALAPALVVMLIALWFGARRVIEPLRRLDLQARRLAEGDYDTLQEPIQGIAEVRQLQETLAAMARRIRSAQQALRGYIGAVNRAQEEERRRLARELHDETVQDLIAIDQRLQILGMDLKKRRELDPERLEELHRATHQAIQDVRRLSRGLRPIYLEDLGLVPALEMLAQDAQTDLGVPVSFDSEGPTSRLEADAELEVYRIVQEALSNVGRHAQAKQAWVEVCFKPDELAVSVRDDGIGFSPPADASDLGHAGHYGLIGIRERAQLLKANLEVRTAPGRGSEIRIVLPLEDRPQA